MQDIWYVTRKGVQTHRFRITSSEVGRSANEFLKDTVIHAIEIDFIVVYHKSH